MTPLLLTLWCAVAAADPSPASKYFQITVVDEQTGRGVPLVELKTVNDIRLYTDSNGVAAFFEPGLMNQKVYFHVRSHGYEFAKDGFGYRGRALAVSEGGSARLTIRRSNIAERLYRVTGAGIYRDSALLGKPVPIRAPLLNGQVFGSDSIVAAVYRGKIHWFWGDTNRPAYPLGNFHVPGAVSDLPIAGGLDPEQGINLHYFVDEQGFAKTTARMPGDGPTWITGLVTLTDKTGRERMFAMYMKVRKLLEVYERGLVEFNSDKNQFEHVATFAADAPVYPAGHPFLRTVNGQEHVYFCHPFPHVRVRADPESLRRLDAYEAFTCLTNDSRAKQAKVDRDSAGYVRYRWRKDSPLCGPNEQKQLLNSGRLKPNEICFRLLDANTGKAVTAHGGSVYWNAYRRRWVSIVVETFGTSLLGEVWYAEADAPEGPWTYAQKVVTHDRYSFYNPKQHPFFDKHDGRIIFFEGTYTHTFSGNPEQTPRYDYNQVMYKLDLADPRLFLPVAVYRFSADQGHSRLGTEAALKTSAAAPVAFYAPDRHRPGTIPIYARLNDGIWRLEPSGLQAPDGKTPPLFYALPADAKEAPAACVPLYEFAHRDGQRRWYSTDEKWTADGFHRQDRPLCRVWHNPVAVDLPRDERKP